MWKYCHGEDTVEELKYLACKYGEMQIHFGQENPVICDDYPINGAKQCDECEIILGTVILKTVNLIGQRTVPRVATQVVKKGLVITSLQLIA